MDRYVEYYDSQTEGLERGSTLQDRGFHSLLEWFAGRRQWRLTYWKAEDLHRAQREVRS